MHLVFLVASSPAHHCAPPSLRSLSLPPEPQVTLVASSRLQPPLGMKDTPPSPVCIPHPDEGLTYVAVLASVARGAQAYDVSLCLLAGPRATGILGTGPGGGCNPRERLSIKKPAAGGAAQLQDLEVGARGPPSSGG